MNISKVLILGDLFRCQTTGAGSVWAHINVLHRLFSGALGRLGVDIYAIYSLDAGGLFDVKKLMDSLELPCNPEGWAKSTNANFSEDIIEMYFKEFLLADLVIGWELPVSIVRIFEKNNIPVIDFGISSIRFGGDLFLSARSNDERIMRLISECSIKEDYFWNEASFLRASLSWRLANTPEKREVGSFNDPSKKYGVFVGQTQIDQSLIENGIIRKPVDCIKDISKKFSDVDTILVIPHPYEASKDHLDPIIEAFPNAFYTDEFSYRLLCSDNVNKFVSISSGFIDEAPFFFKEASRLIAPDRLNIFSNGIDVNCFIPVHSSIVDIGFWRTLVFGGESLDFVHPTHISISNIFGMRWGRDSL